MKRILIDVGLDAVSLQRLQALPQVQVGVLPPCDGPRELSAELLGCQVMICKELPTNFDLMVSLEYLQLSSVGYEHLRDKGLAGRPLRVCNARGVFDTAIAEWNLAMMINLTRDIRLMIRQQDQCFWNRTARFQQEIRDRVVGLWGYGGIGRESARLSKALGMKVHVMTRSGVRPRNRAYAQSGTGDPDGVLPDRVFTRGQESDFLGGLDFLILALPHTKQSDGMVGERQLRALPRTAFVLNPARGPIIQEHALLTALREGWIAGSALDTHFAYPLPPDHPLWLLPNVILTPHISGADQSSLFQARIGDLFVQNVQRFLTGQPLLNEITAHEWLEA